MNPFYWDEPQIFTFFFVLVRVTSLMVFLPIFGDRTIPSVIKILFGLAFSFVAFPLAWSQGVRIAPEVMDSPGRTGWLIACDMGFGIMLGFAAKWVFDAVQFAGHFTGTSIGFSMASVLDPHSETQTIALAELQYLLAAMLFLAMDGHHLYLSVILQSFKIVPLGQVNFLANGDSLIQYLIHLSSEVVIMGLKLSAPAMVVILLINLTFGIIGRAVPQMNVMAVSFAVNIMVGLFVVVVSLPGFVNMVGGAFDTLGPELFRFMRLFHG